MKTATKNLLGKAAGLSLAAALFVSAAPAVSALTADAYGVSEETTSLLTSNLIKDGSFEGLAVTTEDGNPVKAGAWNIDTASSTAGAGNGTVEIVSDGAFSGENALKLKIAGNKSGYPEISQPITVLPNTTYYVSMRVKVDGVLTGSSNIFFGIASASREKEKIYGESHRYNDNGVDKDHAADANGYSLYSARITTGNETDCRLFVRVEKAGIIIDDVSVTYEGNIIPAGSANILKNGGFEESTGADPLKEWVEYSKPENGGEYGIDALNTGTYSLTTQDKQMEGLNTLYVAAKSGTLPTDTFEFGQPVSVEKNSRYAFYVNLSKYGDAKVAATDGDIGEGLQTVTVGIYNADKSEVLAQKRVDGADVSMARYLLTGVSANTGENETVIPFVKLSATGSGTYGQCLYVDDCSFFKTALDLPEGKTNLLSNGDFASGEDDWYIINGWSNGENPDAPFVTENNLGVNQYYPYVGILQSATLKADSLYKATAFVEGWKNLPYPANILVIKGDDETVNNTINEAIELWKASKEEEAWTKYGELEVVAKQSVYPEKDMVYRPVNLIFPVTENGTYTILVGYEKPADVGDDGNQVFLGGMNIGGVSLYETSMEELSPVKEEETQIVFSSDDNFVLAETSVTVPKDTAVAAFKDAVYAAAGYDMKVVDKDGNEVTSGNMQSDYKVVISKDGEVVKELTVSTDGTAVTPIDPNKPDQPDKPTDPTDKKDGLSAGAIAGIVVGCVAVVAVAAVAVVLVKKKKNNK